MVYEFIMLWLYVFPLYMLDLDRRGRSKVFEYSSFQKEKNCSLLKGEAYLGLQLKNISTESTYSGVKLNSAPLLLQRYHQSVRRNYYSGVLSVVVSLQFMIVYLSFNNRSEIGRMYWFSGIGLIHFSLSFFLMYTCLVLSDRDWRYAFIPCECGESRATDYVALNGGNYRGQAPDELIAVVEDEKVREMTQESIRSMMQSLPQRIISFDFNKTSQSSSIQ